ncbi:MAG TPA: hypothetical protein VKA89_03525 [Solirubrobacterales bacterium]|nr:hypothetical protein [Solirubrobacterales bacterium]
MDELAARLRAQRGPDAAIAFGALALGAATTVAFARVEEDWAAFPLLLLAAIPCAVLFGLALIPERGVGAEERTDLRGMSWRPATLIVALVLLAVSLIQLVVVLGNDDPGSGTFTWVFLLTGLLGLVLAARHDSPGLQIVGLLFLAAAFLAATDWIDGDAGTTAFRNVLLLVGVLFLFAARSLRPVRLDHSHVAVAVGVLLLVLGALLGALGDIDLGSIIFGVGDGAEIGDEDGWELVLVLVSLGALAYAAWQRYRGAAYPGLLGIIAFVAIAEDGSLAGWPLILLLAAAGSILYGFAGAGDTRQGPAVRGSGAPSSETSGGV